LPQLNEPPTISDPISLSSKSDTTPPFFPPPPPLPVPYQETHVEKNKKSANSLAPTVFLPFPLPSQSATLAQEEIGQNFRSISGQSAPHTPFPPSRANGRIPAPAEPNENEKPPPPPPSPSPPIWPTPEEMGDGRRNRPRATPRSDEQETEPEEGNTSTVTEMGKNTNPRNLTISFFLSPPSPRFFFPALDNEELVYVGRFSLTTKRRFLSFFFLLFFPFFSAVPHPSRKEPTKARSASKRKEGTRRLSSHSSPLPPSNERRDPRRTGQKERGNERRPDRRKSASFPLFFSLSGLQPSR